MLRIYFIGGGYFAGKMGINFLQRISTPFHVGRWGGVGIGGEDL